jgi:4-coumarate--CoA ligase
LNKVLAARPWWRATGALAAFLASLVEGELGQLRPGRAPGQIADDCDLAAGLGADSLELMALTAAVADVLQLPQAAMLDGLLTDPRMAAWTETVMQALETAQPEALCFRTSGSAGRPKPCRHEMVSLWQEVEQLAALLPDTRRIVSLVPAHHIYGFLFTVLLPQALGDVAVLDARGRVAAGVWQDLRAGDVVIGFPDVWQAALAGSAAVPAGVTGVTSTAPCSQALADSLVQRGLARLLQVYGSSETAGVGWRDRADQPYRCFPYWQRVADDEALLARVQPDGSRQLHRLQDRLVWQDDGHFLPAGRIDAAVQVGGVNVFPERVAATLRAHPLVQDAAVRLMRPDEGARLKAFIVPVAGAPGDVLAMLDAHARAQLSSAERPAAYNLGAALPRQRNGKPADWMIEE